MSLSCFKKISAAITACPNDTWSFAQWKEKFSSVVDLSVLPLGVLNHCAQTSALFQISKLSVATFFTVSNTYIALPSGASFARDCGPCLVWKKGKKPSFPKSRLAIPGQGSSAYMAFCLLYGLPRDVVEVPPENIVQAVVDGACDAGIVIHASRGFPQDVVEFEDLGVSFHQRYQVHLPLGIIAVHRSMCDADQKRFAVGLRDSICCMSTQDIPDFVLQHAKSWNTEHIRTHISQYVSEDTVYMSDAARQSLYRFFEIARAKELIPNVQHPCVLQI